jgi:UDP-4-amino-4,6-dideoxy-N-acetyl-beta-L-altrosamine transaminase
MIPYGRQEITQADIDAVVEVLRSDFLTQGPAVPRFETLLAARVGAPHAVAANSATSALHLACMALDLAPGDLLWTVPNTFVASANCGRYCGADVDFVDIDQVSWNISIPALHEKLLKARRESRLPKVLVAVHFAGQPTEQEDIWLLANEFGFRIIEDASHAIGAARNGEPVGSCRWSDITVFSFHPVKIITSAEGGMATTRDPMLAERMRLLRSHGITRDASKFRGFGGDPPAWAYEQQQLGYNYRMTDVQAALGASQLARLDEYVAARNARAQRYGKLLTALPLTLPTVLPGNLSAFHLYVVRLQPAPGRPSRRRLFDQLREQGIGVNLHYMPVHLQPYYRDLGFMPGQYPQAERYAEEAISLPLFAVMSDAQQDTVVTALEEALS